MTKREKKTVTVIIVIALAIIAMIFGYTAAKNKAAEVKTVKTQVTAEVDMVKKEQETPAPSTVVAKRTKAAAATTPVITNTDNYAYDATLNMSASEISELTTVTNEGEKADNLNADDIVAPNYKTPEEKEAEREAEKAEIEAEKEAEVEVKNDKVVEVPEIKEEIKDLEDNNGEVIDDTEDAVVDYEPAVDSAVCDCDSDDHNHVVTTEGGFTYIFCDRVEEIKVIDGVKYMPWIYFGFENEAAYVAATTPVEEVEVVEVVEVEAEEVEEETTEAIETEEVVVAEEIVEETVEEVVEAEEVETVEETTVSGNEI
jgi:hypothetical protein